MIMRIFNKLVYSFLGNSEIIFNICTIVALVLIVHDQIEENSKKKHRAR